MNGSVRSEVSSAGSKLSENLVKPNPNPPSPPPTNNGGSSSGGDSVGWAFVKGLGQGVLNICNAITNIAIGTFVTAYNTTSYVVNCIGGSNPYISNPISDWSRGLIVDEGTLFGFDAHNISIMSCEIGVSCAIAAQALSRAGAVATAPVAKPQYSPKVVEVGDDIAKWLGKGSRQLTSNGGDRIFQSQNGLREVRLDLNRFFPHDKPHMHIIEYGMENLKKIKDVDIRFFFDL